MSNTIPMPHPYDVAEPPKKPELMFACIERKHGLTFCNRAPDSKEFMFAPSAYRHVVAHYDARTMKRSAVLRLTACNQCVDLAKEIIAKEDESRLA